MPGEAGAGAAGPDPSGGLSSHNGANAANGRGARRRGAAGATAVPGPHYKWIALSNTTLGILMVTINQSILLISLPAIFRGIRLNPLVPANTSYLLWMFMGFLLVTAVLVVSFGRLGDMYGRVRMYNLGFAVFTVFSILLSVTWMNGTAGALWIIVLRIFQGVGGAFLFANSTAILTDAFPANQRGKALGINGDRRDRGLVPRPAARRRARARSTGAWCSWSRSRSACSAPSGPTSCCTTTACASPPGSTGWATSLFAVGLIALLIGITYGLLPYGGHPIGWTNPWVLAAIFGGIAVLVLFGWVETRVAEPMFRLGLFRIRAFAGGQHRQPARRAGPRRHAVHADHLAAGHLAAAARLQLRQTPLWAGIYMIPLTLGFLIVRAARRASLSDRYGARLFATGGADADRALRSCCCCCRSTSATGCSRCSSSVRGRHGPVLLAEPGRGDEQPAARPARRRRAACSTPSRTRPPCCPWACSSRSS